MTLQCPRCGAQNEGSRLFCGACGERLGEPHYCPHCGDKALDPREFCRRCGNPFRSSMDDGPAGVAYALNHLGAWARAGALDPAATVRLRAYLERELLEESSVAAPEAAGTSAVAVAPPAPVVPSGPSAIDVLAERTRVFATEQTPSLLLYIGAFLVVTSAFIFVNVSGDQISDLVKLTLMLVGTLGFLGAGIVCHRYPRVLPAGRTFLVIGALITPLDVVAYYVLVARTSPLDTPTLWVLGSLVSAALYAALRIGGYGLGYSYLFYGAVLSAIFGVEAMVKLPIAWAAVPFAALAIVVERTRALSAPAVAALIGPLPRMTAVVAGLAGTALVVPIASPVVVERVALPVGIALLTVYYALRARGGGAAWEAILASIGPGATIVALTFAATTDLAVVGLASVLVGCTYVSHDVVPPVDRAVKRWAPWALPPATTIGLALLLAGVVPLDAYGRAPFFGAVAYLAAGAALAILALVWDERPGPFAYVRGHSLLVPAAIAIAIGYRFALGASGALPLAVTGIAELARAYAPLSILAWAGTAALGRRSRPHAETAGWIAATSSVAVSLGSFDDAPAHTVVNLVYAAGAAVVGIRLASRPALWAAGTAAMLGALGAYRWSGALPVWIPLFALAPAALALGVSYVPAVRALRPALLQVAIAGAAIAAALGAVQSVGGPGVAIAPWDTDVWRTTMLAVAAAGLLGVIEARRRLSIEIGLAAAVALPLLIDMAVATAHPTLPEPLTVPFALFAFAAVWVARRSRIAELRSWAPVIEYFAAAVALAPTVLRAHDIGTLLAGALVALALIGAASRWPSAPTAHVSLAALGWLAATQLVTNPRLDEIRIAAGAALLALCVATVRYPRLVRTPDVTIAEIVAAALIVVPTAAVTLQIPGARDIDLPVALLLVVELAALYAVAVIFQRLVLLRATIVGSCVAAAEFVALPTYGEVYAALLGSAMINSALAVARRWPGGRTLREHAVLGTLGVGILFLPSLGDSLAAPTLQGTAEMLAAGIGVAIVAGVLGERWITGAALAVVGVESAVVVRSPALLQIPGVAAGAVLLALAVAFPRFRRGGLPRPFATALDAMGVWLYALPTFLLTFSSTATLQNAILMAQALVLTIVGLTFRRRWQILAAIVLIAIQALRAILDVVNRIPNWATFAIAGALLLTIGFLLLLKRELFEKWRRRMARWWIAWLATPS